MSVSSQPTGVWRPIIKADRVSNFFGSGHVCFSPSGGRERIQQRGFFADQNGLGGIGLGFDP